MKGECFFENLFVCPNRNYAKLRCANAPLSLELCTLLISMFCYIVVIYSLQKYAPNLFVHRTVLVLS